MIELHNMDCMEYMKGLEDNSFDLAIVDPPYGIGESGKTNSTRSCIAESKNYKPFAGEDLLAPNPDYFDQLKRVSKNQIIWGANHFIDNFPFMCNSSCWIVWDKDNGLNDFADCELAWASFKTAVRKFKFTWHGMIQGDMKNKEHRIHPTQKPVKLYEWLLANYAKEGGKILDTHLGSGSSAIAAHYGGFDFVGCELDEDYFKAAQERIERETAQLDMF
ncbi:MAG: site-specific DNA-methyltransferase [Chloroflexi bacterium]|nr:site-specific DNA-methyltransferase [Chloroflexota bacterium]